MRKDKAREPSEKSIEEDQRRFERWYRPFHGDLTLCCLGWVKDAVVSEQILEQVLVKLFQLKDPETLVSIEDWLFTTAQKGCLAYVAKHSQRAGLERGSPS